MQLKYLALQQNFLNPHFKLEWWKLQVTITADLHDLFWYKEWKNTQPL